MPRKWVHLMNFQVLVLSQSLLLFLWPLELVWAMGPQSIHSRAEGPQHTLVDYAPPLLGTLVWRKKKDRNCVAILAHINAAKSRYIPTILKYLSTNDLQSSP